MSVTVTNANYTHPDDHTRQTTDTPGFKPYTIVVYNYHVLYMVAKGQEMVREKKYSSSSGKCQGILLWVREN